MAQELLTQLQMYPYGPNGGRLYVDPSLDMQRISTFFKSSHAFAADECHFQHEQTNEPARGYEHMTEDQLRMCALLKNEPFVYAGKGRQSYMSELGIRWLLRETMYLEGCKGVLVADKNSTAEELFSRLNYMYKHLDKRIKVPLANKREEGNEGDIEFIHGGKIVVVSGEIRVPAIGFSPSRAHISELGKMRDQKNLVVNMLPSIMKKAGARIFIETTPGSHGDLSFDYWIDANRGKNIFFPYFIRWYQQPGCSRAVDAKSPEPSSMEMELMQRYGLTRGNIEYMRMILPLFQNDMLAFRNQYPFHEMDGWASGEDSTMPGDVFQPHLRDSVKDSQLELGKSGLLELGRPRNDRKYVIIADTAGISQRPDATAITVFDNKGDEVAFWAGSISPSEAADKVVAAAAIYRGQDHEDGPIVAIESNKSDVIAVLNDRLRMGQVRLKAGQSKLFRWFYDKTRRDWHWWSHEASKKRAEGRLVAVARAKAVDPVTGKVTYAVRLRSYQGIMEVMSYSRDKWKNKRTQDETGSHHYDRAISYLIAADVLTQLKWVSLPEVEDEEAEEVKVEPPVDENGGFLLTALDALFSTGERKRDMYKLPTCIPVRPRKR